MSNKLTPEELQQLKDLQSQYNSLVFEVGELELRKRSILKEYDTVMEAQAKLANALNAKYGIGVIDVETGEIKPQ